MTDDRAVVDAMVDHLMHRYGATFSTRPAAIGCARSMIALTKMVSQPRRRFSFGRRRPPALPPARETERCTLGDCPPGLFLFGEILGFKSEYYARPGVPDAYVVSSGEFFWGGTRGDVAARLALMVTPIEAP